MKKAVEKIVILSTLLTIAVPFAVNAQEGGSGSSRSNSTNAPESTVKSAQIKTAEDQIRKKVEDQKQVSQQKLQDIKSELKQKLDDTKRKICDNHQTQINTIIGNMDDRRQNAYDHITSAYTAVKKFQADKQLVISGYDNLVATIDTAQAAAMTAMKTQQAVPKFTCDGDHPRADITDFKSKRSSSIDAMQTYRQAVKELIRAVKTAATAPKVSQS